MFNLKEIIRDTLLGCSFRVYGTAKRNRMSYLYHDVDTDTDYIVRLYYTGEAYERIKSYLHDDVFYSELCDIVDYFTDVTMRVKIVEL